MSPSPKRVSFREEIDPVPQSMRAAMDGVETLLVLVSNAPDELTLAIRVLKPGGTKIITLCPWQIWLLRFKAGLRGDGS